VTVKGSTAGPGGDREKGAFPRTEGAEIIAHPIHWRHARSAAACCAALAALTLVATGTGGAAAARLGARAAGANSARMLSLVPPQPQLETDFAARHHCAFWAGG